MMLGVEMNPDAVTTANKVACKIYLQLGRNTRRESRCEWLGARRKLGPPRGHRQVPWGGWGVALQQPAAAKRAR